MWDKGELSHRTLATPYKALVNLLRKQNRTISGPVVLFFLLEGSKVVLFVCWDTISELKDEEAQTWTPGCLLYFFLLHMCI